MPVHWYYDVNSLQRDYGWIDSYQVRVATVIARRAGWSYEAAAAAAAAVAAAAGKHRAHPGTL